MTRRRFVIRTIRSGKVRIFGKEFSPYADVSRFNGSRAAFGLYWTGEKWEQRFVSLWGSEKEYRAADGEVRTFIAEDGYFRWEWWYQVAAQP